MDEEEAAEELFQRLYNNVNAEQLTPAQRNNSPPYHPYHVEKLFDCSVDQ